MKNKKKSVKIGRASPAQPIHSAELKATVVQNSFPKFTTPPLQNPSRNSVAVSALDYFTQQSNRGHFTEEEAGEGDLLPACNIVISSKTLENVRKSP